MRGVYIRPEGRFWPPCGFGFENAGASDEFAAPGRGLRPGESAVPGDFQNGAGANSR
jgi:hypothetical protein